MSQSSAVAAKWLPIIGGDANWRRRTQYESARSSLVGTVKELVGSREPNAKLNRKLNAQLSAEPNKEPNTKPGPGYLVVWCNTQKRTSLREAVPPGEPERSSDSIFVIHNSRMNSEAGALTLLAWQAVAKLIQTELKTMQKSFLKKPFSFAKGDA